MTDAVLNVGDYVEVFNREPPVEVVIGDSTYNLVSDYGILVAYNNYACNVMWGLVKNVDTGVVEKNVVIHNVITNYIRRLHPLKILALQHDETGELS